MQSLQKVSPTGSEQRFLRFSVGWQEQALLPVDAILDVFPVQASEILPMPQMHSSVMGLVNRRGSILWLVDLAYLLGSVEGDTPLSETAMAVTITNGEQTLGLWVPQVQDIEPHEVRALQPPTPGLFSPGILPFLQGYLVGEQRDILMVLDPSRLLQSPQWQAQLSVR